MKLLESVKLAMQCFSNSFINRNCEIVLIPKFNVYIGLMRWKQMKISK